MKCLFYFVVVLHVTTSEQHHEPQTDDKCFELENQYKLLCPIVLKYTVFTLH